MPWTPTEGRHAQGQEARGKAYERRWGTRDSVSRHQVDARCRTGPWQGAAVTSHLIIVIRSPGTLPSLTTWAPSGLGHCRPSSLTEPSAHGGTDVLRGTPPRGMGVLGKKHLEWPCLGLLFSVALLRNIKDTSSHTCACGDTEAQGGQVTH